VLREERLSVQRTPQQLADIALQVAREAAAVAAAGWRSHPTVAHKSSRADLVTEYDMRSERLIRERLAELAPELDLVAEEQGGEQTAGPIWYCDPIDGTTNFAHGHHYWSVSIGVLDAGVPIAGAVVAPLLETAWVGWRGGPALRNGQPCGVSSTDVLGDALVATGFPPVRDREPDNNFQSFGRVKRAVRGVRRCGSAAIDSCLVADGTYDAYWERSLHAWDLVGGAAVVLAAGGQVSGLDGGAPQFERGHVLMSNARVHDALLPLICGP
jgi:myo-inositol-1(or 4)-monophosphatase